MLRDNEHGYPLDPPEWLWEGLPAKRPPAGGSKSIEPSPFHYRPSTDLEPRQWIYGRHLIRKFTSVTIAPGGVGKSTLVIVDAVAMASGRDLIGCRPHAPLTVWVWNGEDPREEIERRVIATCDHYNVQSSDIEGRLYLDSGRDLSLKIAASDRNGTAVSQSTVDALVAALIERQIDVLIIDPFVTIHSVPENDNGAMDAVLKALSEVADRANCAIEIVHHTRKLNGGETDMDAARGGSAIAGSVRSARALNAMPPETAKDFGIDVHNRRSYVRIDNVKANLATPQQAKWFRLTGVPLGNDREDRPGDFVAVAESWSPPDVLAGMGASELASVQVAIHNKGYRENIQARNWVGHAVGATLGLNSRADPDRHRIKRMIKHWLETGGLKVITIQDDGGRDRPAIEVDDWVPGARPPT